MAVPDGFAITWALFAKLEKEGLTMFGRKKGPDQPFQHAEDCRIWKTDPGVQIPWSEIRRGAWEAVCVCGKQYHHEPVVDDSVRNDPLKIGHRGAPQCELHGDTDPAVLQHALKAIEKDGYWWVQCGACDTAWQVPYYAESVG